MLTRSLSDSLSDLLTQLLAHSLPLHLFKQKSAFCLASKNTQRITISAQQESMLRNAFKKKSTYTVYILYIKPFLLTLLKRAICSLLNQLYPSKNTN